MLAALLLAGSTPIGLAPDAPPPNILFILADDHRHDALGIAGHPFLRTPHLDRLAAGGVRCTHAVVTTSLCSPSRASILTGLYAHRHRVVDNYNPPSDSLTYFPQLLRGAGYETAFVGKWHMGDTDEPQRGFDHWVSFRGQGVYYPDGHGTSRVVPQASNTGYNINGTRVPQRKYITDELTDHAVEWMTEEHDKPWCLYLSHKAVHSDFVPADRHRGAYANESVPVPPNRHPGAGRPRWLRDQANSRHGAGFAYNLADFDLAAYHRRYCETLLAVDESVGRLMTVLADAGADANTLVVYMGDNGFQFGEQGLIDKRTAYEPSIRVPLILHWPAGLPAGRTVNETVANIDIAPTLLDAAGVQYDPARFDGRSFLPLARGGDVEWRDSLLYEYLWEWNYPHTPTTHAVLGGRWKYIRYHGVWDTDELFDLTADPHETRNLIAAPEHQQTVAELRETLFALLAETDGGSIPLPPDRGTAFPWRKPTGPPPGTFPPRYSVPSEPGDVPAWARGVGP